MAIYPYSFTMPPVNKQDIPSDGVVGEFLGISAGGVLDWLPVAGGGGGGDMLKADNLSGLADYAIARTNIGLGLTSSPEFANLTLTSSSLSSSAPVTISQTWGTTGIYTAFKVVANETAVANTASNLLELWAGNTPALNFRINKNGVAQFGPTSSRAVLFDANGGIGVNRADNSLTTALVFLGQNTAPRITIVRDGTIGWSQSQFDVSGGNATPDTVLLRDGAANTLALRNGAAPQTFNVYGTYTSITDYKRLSLSCSASTGDATIGVPFNSVLAVTGGTAPSSIATITFATQPAAFPVGSNVVVAGVTPSGYNGIYVVTASTTSSVSYTVGGPLAAWSSGGTATVSGSSSLIVNTALEAKSVNVTGTAIPAVGIYQQSSNSLGFSVASTLCWRINNSGGFIAGADNTFDIGASGANRPRDIYAGGNGIFGGLISAQNGFRAPSSSQLIASANGIWRLTNSDANDFNRLQFGGTTNLFPAIKRNGAGLQIRLADDSANATLEAGNLYSSGNVGIGTTSPTSKLHVAGSSSPSITVDNTLATGASQLLFKNTVVTGDTDGIFLNGSTQTGFGGAGSLNIKATTGPLAFHTASVTNALSIAQNGVATFAGNLNLPSNATILSNNVNYITYNGTTLRFWTAAQNATVNINANTSTYSGSSGTLTLNPGGSSSNYSFTSDDRLQFGGASDSFPAIKRSTTRIQAVLATTSTTFTNIQGKLTTDTDYTATVVTPTGFLTLYDAQGNAYKVPCVAA